MWSLSDLIVFCVVGHTCVCFLFVVLRVVFSVLHDFYESVVSLSVCISACFYVLVLFSYGSSCLVQFYDDDDDDDVNLRDVIVIIIRGSRAFINPSQKAII